MVDEMLLGWTIVVCDTNWQLTYKQQTTKATDTNNETLIQQYRGMEARPVNELSGRLDFVWVSHELVVQLCWKVTNEGYSNSNNW